MTLVERCETLSAELTSLERARQTAHLRAAVAGRLEEWKEKRDEIAELCGAMQWLGVAAAEDSQAGPALREVQTRAAAIREKLTVVEDIENLNRNAQWTRFHKFVDEKIKLLEDRLKDEWRLHIEKVGAFQTPEVLESQSSRTPQNVAALREYVEAYRRFRSVVALPRPRGPEDLIGLSSCAGQLALAFKAFDFAVPAEVDRFFKAVAAGGAPLALLNETVRNWLAGEGLENEYLVKARLT